MSSMVFIHFDWCHLVCCLFCYLGRVQAIWGEHNLHLPATNMAAAQKLICTFLFLVFCFYGARASLYSGKDPMVILDNSTIKENIYNSKNVWIVEFYSSWCGHCHAFAPTWKKFAKQVQCMYENLYIFCLSPIEKIFCISLFLLIATLLEIILPGN